MELPLSNYEIYTYKQRENIQYTITSMVVSVSTEAYCHTIVRIKLKDSNRWFYRDFVLYNNIDVDVNDKVEIIYKLVVEGQYLKALIVDIKKL